MSYQKLLFFEPSFAENIWGGQRLRTEFGYDIPYEHTGECWAFSALPGMESTVKDGEYKGKTLAELWENNPEIFGEKHSEAFPILIKFIGAENDLSIQVHPDNSYAFANENGSLGKKECWYILDCPKEAELVVGHNANTKKELEEMVRGGKWSELIRRHPIKKGDFIEIDPGTVHAITAGVLLIEIQQSSNITYRLYDYDRLSNGKPRELHIDKSLDVITVPAPDSDEIISSTSNYAENKLHQLISNEYFTVYKIKVNGSISGAKGHLYNMVSVVDGSCLFNSVPVKKGDHFLVPVGVDMIKIDGNAELIITTY